ncbi:MAG: hypothetical protein JSW24_04845 [Dehalococcoidia bacterium]|nr:MAG: hypothetical protein JSW24_04845 [Dehalococcoidia bacterium]
MKDKIKGEIKKSGFPLELYVLNICSKKNTGRMPNIHYVYEGKLREIDLYAFFEEINLHPKKGENLQHTSTSMIVACKKSEERPWVFFSSSMHQSEDVFYFTKYVSEFDSYLKQEGKYPLPGQIYKDLEKNHYMDKTISKCITYSEAFKKDRSSPSQIYEAIESVLNFLRYRRELYLRHLKKLGCFTEFFFPVIVLDGLLFEARLEGEEVNLVEKDHIQLRTDYAEEIFIIDVVRKGNFKNFFQSIEKDHLSFVKAINKLRCPKDYKTRLRRKIDQELKEFKLPFPPEFYQREVWKRG